MRWIIRRLSYANVAATLALFMALGGTAYAATGGAFVLGRNNAASTQTILTSTNTGAALALRPRAGQPPLSTSSNVKSPNLNADLLDGVDSTAFARVGGSTGYIVGEDPNGNDAEATCPAGTKLTGGGAFAAGTDNVLFASAPNPMVSGTWAASAVPSGEDLFAIAVCYNPKGAVPGATPSSVISALQKKAAALHRTAR
jgi:hypothetical protein